MAYLYEYIDEYHKAVTLTDEGYVLHQDSIFNLDTVLKITIPITCLGYLYARKIESTSSITCNKGVCVSETLKCTDLKVDLYTQCGTLKVANADIHELRTEVIDSGNVHCTTAWVNNLTVDDIICTNKLMVLENAVIKNTIKAQILLVEKSLTAKTLDIQSTCDIKGSITASTYMLGNTVYDKMVKVQYNKHTILLLKNHIVIDGSTTRAVDCDTNSINTLVFNRDYSFSDWWLHHRDEIKQLHSVIYQ